MDFDLLGYLYADMCTRIHTHVSAQRTCVFISGVHIRKHLFPCMCMFMQVAAVYDALNSTLPCHLFAIAGFTPAAPIRLYPSMTHTSTSGMSSTVRPTTGV